MRKMITLTAIAAAAFATVAQAQQQPTQQQPTTPPPSPAAPAQATPSPTLPPVSAPTIQSINILDLEQLPQETQKKVNDVVAQGGESNLKQLRDSVDATPQATAALKDKGLTSHNVLVASLSEDGVLTLVTTKKAS
jgi:hypothetical protein